MIPTDFLFQLARFEEIEIEWANLTLIKGLYIYTPSLKTPVIVLANSLHNDERLLRCVLSHELGHHHKTAGHHTVAANGLTSVYATKNERAATKWAVNLMIQTDAFLECLKAGMDKYQLADFFLVSPGFVALKGEYVWGSEKHCRIVSELRTCYNVCF